MARGPQAIDVDEVPEADRLEGFPHPRMAETVFGHEPAERMLAEASRDGRLHHGWLFEGPPGIGKASLAYRFARYLLARESERAEGLAVAPTSVARRQVRALSHPALLVIRRPYNMKEKRFAASIPVDEVRRLRGFLSHAAIEGAWRVVIVDSADEMNANAANALLKSLEEPPPRTVFLLVTSEPGGILPTIRSRCRVLALAPLGREALRRAVRQALAASETDEPEPSAWATLEAIGRGSPRRVLAMLAGGGLDLHGRVTRLVAALPAVDWTGVHALGDELQDAAAEQRFELFYELLLDALARLVRVAATGEGSEAEREAAGRIVGARRLATFAELWETVARAKGDTLALNLDRKALILDTVRELEAAARS